MKCSSSYTTHVKCAFMVKRLVFNSNCSVFHVRRDIAACNRNTLDCVIILPKQRLSSPVVVANASWKIIARYISNIRKILPEVRKHTHEEQEAHNNTDTEQFKGHD